MVGLLTARLALREAKLEDVETLSAYQCDLRYLENYSTPPDATTIIAKAQEWTVEVPRRNFQFILTLRGDDTAIGCAGLRGIGYPPHEAEIGIELDPKHWGSGFASEAVAELVAFARRQEITALYAVTSRRNVRARKLFESARFSVNRYDGDDVILQKQLAGER